MRKLIVFFVLVLFGFFVSNAWAKEKSGNAPSQSAYEHASDNAAFKNEEKMKKKAERDAEKAKKKAEREAEKTKKKAEREAEKTKKKAEREAETTASQSVKEREKKQQRKQEKTKALKKNAADSWNVAR